MSDFLERLSHRSVPSTVGEPAVAPLEPRLPSRFEAQPTPTREGDTGDLVEEHVTAQAQAATPAPITPRPAPEAPSPNDPPQPENGTITRGKASVPFVPSISDSAVMAIPAVAVPRLTEQQHEPAPGPGTAADPPEAEPGTITRGKASVPFVPLISDSAVMAIPEPAVPRLTEQENEPALRPRTAADPPAPAPDSSQKPADRKPAAVPPLPPVTVTPLELVVVQRRTPAARPTVPAPRPGGRKAAGRQRSQPTTSPPVKVSPRAEVPRSADGDRRTETRPGAVVFEPHEPLATVGLEPLTDHELLSVPAVADVAPPNGVVHVHIGRLEITRPAPMPPSPPPPPRRRAPTLSLDDYLAQRTDRGADTGRRR